MADEPVLRASDADRERAAAQLRDGAAEGRLTLEELTARLDRAWSARTVGELRAVTADLPAAASPTAAEPATAGRRRTRWLVAIMGGTSRRGRWRAAARMRAVALMGGVDIDLRHAELERREVTIVAVALMGGVTVRVPDGVEVDLDGFVLMGGKDARVGGDAPRPGGPRVVVHAWGAMGGVSVIGPPRTRDGATGEDDAA